MDNPYREKIIASVLQAIIAASMTDQLDARGLKVAMLLNAEIEDALLQIIAINIAGSEALNTPQKVRQQSEALALRLRRYVLEAQKLGPVQNFQHVHVSNVH